MKILISASFFIFALSSCCTLNKEIANNTSRLKIQAEEKYGGNSKYIFNSDSSYALVIDQKKSTADNPFPLLKFFVYDYEKDTVIYEDILANSKVNWKNNHLIEVDTTPETISKGNINKSLGYIYDLKLKKKINFD